MKSVRKVGLAAALVLAATAAFAPASFAGGFVAEEYPVAVTATPTTEMGQLSFGVVQSCGFSLGGATLSKPDSLVTPVSKTRCGNAVKTNDCEVAFHPGTGSAGTVDIGPAGCKGIEVTVKTCQYTISPQSIPATFEGIGSGSSAAVLVNVKTYGFKWSGCGSPGGKENGTYIDSWEFAATGGLGEPTGLYTAASGIYLDGEESAEPGQQPKFNVEWSAGWSGATPLNGTQTSPHSLHMGIRAFTCNTVELDGTLEPEVTQGAGITLFPAYKDCVGNGNLVDVDASACYYGVEVLNVGPPYVGNLNIACEAGKGIDMRFYASEQMKKEGKTACVLRVPSQELSGVGLENTGTGLTRGLALNLSFTNVTWTVLSGNAVNCGKGNSKGVYTGSASVLGLQ